MRSTACLTAPIVDTAIADRITSLRHIVNRLQTARYASAELDRMIAHALRDLSKCEAANGTKALLRQESWSSDITQALELLPQDYNFSMGCRDGVCWAWIQPNDHWQPSEYESRHDHPRGSGLVVAHTPALALCSATVNLCIRQIESAI